MGIISFLCVTTKESFIRYSQDTKANINSNRKNYGINIKNMHFKLVFWKFCLMKGKRRVHQGVGSDV